MRDFYEVTHVRIDRSEGTVSPLDIHRRCDAHVAARHYGPSFSTSHVIFRSCTEVELNLPQQWSRQVAASSKIAPGLDAWYDGLTRLNLFAAGSLGIAVLETLVTPRAVHHALHPEYLYVLFDNASVREPVCHTAQRGLQDTYTRVKNMMSVPDIRNGYPRLSSVCDSQMLITAA